MGSILLISWERGKGDLWKSTLQQLFTHTPSPLQPKSTKGSTRNKEKKTGFLETKIASRFSILNCFLVISSFRAAILPIVFSIAPTGSSNCSKNRDWLILLSLFVYKSICSTRQWTLSGQGLFHILPLNSQFLTQARNAGWSVSACMVTYSVINIGEPVLWC